LLISIFLTGFTLTGLCFLYSQDKVRQIQKRFDSALGNHVLTQYFLFFSYSQDKVRQIQERFDSALGKAGTPTQPFDALSLDQQLEELGFGTTA